MLSFYLELFFRLVLCFYGQEALLLTDFHLKNFMFWLVFCIGSMCMADRK